MHDVQAGTEPGSYLGLMKFQTSRPISPPNVFLAATVFPSDLEAGVYPLFRD